MPEKGFRAKQKRDEVTAEKLPSLRYALPLVGTSLLNYSISML